MLHRNLPLKAASLLLAVILFYWVNHPEKRWLTWVLGAAFVLFMAFPVLGLLVT